LCQFQSCKLPEFFESSLRRNVIAKMSEFLQVACLAGRTSPPSGPVKTPGPTATEASRTRVVVTRAVVNQVDNQEDDVAGDGDVGGSNATNLPPPAAPPKQPPAGGGAEVPEGGGDDPDDGDEDMEDNDSKESESEPDATDDGQPEDPENAGNGKFYKAQTPNGKKMVKMFQRSCDLSDCDPNVIVMYFSVYSKARFAEFLHDHWKDTFTQWQERHPNRDGSKWAMVLSPPQQDCIRCAPCACQHRCCVP
jgi:hypothetical protein